MGIWKTLNNQPGFNASTMLLLTDGTVMCHDEGPAFGGSPWWFGFKPDAKGSYLNGSWSRLADSPNAPLFYASAVLRNGRVFVAGGEYCDGLNWDLLAAQVYNPDSDLWSVAATPAGWTKIGDAPSCMLPDGRLLVGSIDTNQTAIYDPSSNTWAPAATKQNQSSSEETWTLLPDETILTVDCVGNPGAEKYLIASDQWIAIDPTPVDLVEANSLEIGPAILLPDGRVFAIGATGHTALYSMPPISSQGGAWVSGPDIPGRGGHPVLGAKDAPACLLPDGKVLCAVGPVDGQADSYLAPTYFFEFDPVGQTLNPVADPPSNSPDSQPFSGRLLLLPTGEVLFSNGTGDISLYQPTGVPDPSWKPSINSIIDGNGTSVSVLARGASFTLTGLQLNGLSQAVSYGDDAQMATNYPLVRLHNTSNGDVVYCRTHDHSTMGVATGNVLQETTFEVPSGTAAGPYELQAVANGIASAPHAVTVA